MKTKVKEGKFINRVIENFKNPTIAQIKALELFLSSASNKITSDEKDLIKLTLNSCNNVQKMIENYLFVSKLSCEKICLNYEYFNLSKLINAITDEMDILFKYSNLTLNKKLGDIEIYADKLKIKTALENIFTYIINSAFKNTEIKISLSGNKSGIKFEIIFCGCCENVKEFLQIFKQNSECPLKYIELYIFKEIIKSHFGKIIFKNLEENYNIAGFFIPLK